MYGTLRYKILCLKVCPFKPPPNLKTKATINYAQHSDIYMKAALRRDELTLGDAYHLCQPSPC